MNFYVLHDEDNQQRLTENNHEEMSDFKELVECPSNKGHPRGGKRLKPMSVEIAHHKVIYDFVWTWTNECLVQQSVVQFLQDHHVTGYRLEPVKVKYRRGTQQPPQFQELRITGWGGVARPESGIQRQTRCPDCGYQRYSGTSDPSQIFDEQQWDGSDIFMIWPLPMYVLITERLKLLLEATTFKGYKIKTPQEAISPDGEPVKGFSPGKLRNYFLEERAHQIGDPLDIF